MKVIPPISISPFSSTINEPDTGEVAWMSGGTYGVGDVRILTSTHRKYECTVAVTGSTVPPNQDNANWRDAGPTNKYAMFDIRNSAQTIAAGAALVVEIEPGRRINGIGLRNLYGSSVRIQMSVAGVPIHDDTINLLLRNTTTWTQYFYGQFRVLKALARFNLPMSTGARLKITIQPTAGFAKCGAIVVGMAEDLGTIIDEPSSGQLSLSKINRDEIDGTTSFVKRRTVSDNSHRVRAAAARLDRLRELREELDATPAFFSGVDDNEDSHFFETLLVLGFPRKWQISLRAQSVISDIQLEEI